MRLRDQIRAAACVCWGGVMGSAIYFSCEAEHAGRAGVIREGTAGGTLPAGLGAQDAPTRPGNRQGTPPESLAAKAGSPGFADCPSEGVVESCPSLPAWRLIEPVDSLRGARHVPAPESTLLELERNPVPGSYRTLAADAARKCLVPRALFLEQIGRESSWRPSVVSSAGAVGLAQLKPYHGHRLLDIMDPETNLNLGACLLRRHYDRVRRYVDEERAWALALAAYHAGPYRTRNGPTTRRYVADIVRGSAQ